MNPEKIANIIKKIRKDNNLTQKEFASKYNVTYQAVSKWETGKNLPDITLIKQICDDFNIDIENLFEGEYKEKDSKKTKKTNLISIIIIIILIIILLFLIIKLNKNNKFELKNISSTCDNFNVYGSIAFNKNNASINISNINYCGEENHDKYKKIECDLYEVHGDSKTKITSCDYKQEKEMTLETYLKNINLNINNYKRVCKEVDDENLYLEINATDNRNKTTLYKIPLILGNNK